MLIVIQYWLQDNFLMDTENNRTRGHYQYLDDENDMEGPEAGLGGQNTKADLYGFRSGTRAFI